MHYLLKHWIAIDDTWSRMNSNEIITELDSNQINNHINSTWKMLSVFLLPIQLEYCGHNNSCMFIVSQFKYVHPDTRITRVCDNHIVMLNWKCFPISSVWYSNWNRILHWTVYNQNNIIITFKSNIIASICVSTGGQNFRVRALLNLGFRLSGKWEIRRRS